MITFKTTARASISAAALAFAFAATSAHATDGYFLNGVGAKANGEAGVARMLQLIAAELHVAMALGGFTAIDQIDRSALAAP